MISYDLAKKLKDAGYPQKGSLWACKHMPENSQGWCDECDKKGEDIYLPTLSELIEACNVADNGFQLMYLSGQKCWTVMNSIPEMELVFGPTPEEAVASLWLALKK